MKPGMTRLRDRYETKYDTTAWHKLLLLCRRITQTIAWIIEATLKQDTWDKNEYSSSEAADCTDAMWQVKPSKIPSNKNKGARGNFNEVKRQARKKWNPTDG